MRVRTMRVTPTIERIEQEYGKPLRDVLLDLYHAQGLSLGAIGKLLGVHKTTVLKWFVALDLPTRQLMLPPEARDLASGQ